MKKIALLICIVLVQNMLSQSVTLDPTFGTNGKVVSSLVTGDIGILASELQSDGKMVVCGYKNVLGNPNPNDTILARFDTNGSLDTSFGSGGYVLIANFFSEGLGARRLLIQSDGKIIITGSKSANGTYSNLNFYTYRYTSNGVLDLTFGNQGVVITDINNSQDEANAIAIQSDNKIIVGGIYQDVSKYKIALVRYNVDGVVDSDFGVNGKFIMPINLVTDYDDSLIEIKMTTNNKIILGVKSYVFSFDTNFGLVQLNSDGTLDTTFGVDGYLTTDFGGQDNITVIQENDSHYYALGYSSSSNGSKIAISKYSVAGELDTSFGLNGKVLINRNLTNDYDAVYDGIITTSDKILCTGVTRSNNISSGFNPDFLLIQFNLDGTIDTGFNSNGSYLTQFGIPNFDYSTSIEIQNDGKIVCFGTTEVSSSGDFALARYLTDNLSTTQTFANQFSIAPNPFQNQVHISGLDTSIALIELYDVSGRLLTSVVFQNEVNYMLPINENLTNGTYFLKITSDQKTETHEIIKQ